MAEPILQKEVYTTCSRLKDSHFPDMKLKRVAWSRAVSIRLP